jgi:hypothetical protein
MSVRGKAGLLFAVAIFCGLTALVAEAFAALCGAVWVLSMTPASLFGIGVAVMGWLRWGRHLPGYPAPTPAEESTPQTTPAPPSDGPDLRQ